MCDLYEHRLQTHQTPLRSLVLRQVRERFISAVATPAVFFRYGVADLRLVVSTQVSREDAEERERQLSNVPRSHRASSRPL